MQLANKLQNLIHLAEVERKLQEAQAQVRMAEDTAIARAEGSESMAAEKGGGAGKSIAELQREVYARVVEMLELNQLRRQDDPDNDQCWW